MRHIMYMLVMVALVQSAHHLRQSKLSILKGQNAIFAEREDVQYIDDDVQLGTEEQQQEQTISEINVHDKQNKSVEDEEEAVIQADEEQTLTQEQMDELDKKEQEEYERLKKQKLQEQHLNDDDSYLQGVDEQQQGQTLIVEQGGEMPVDVVEHQLTPMIPKDPIPDQKGTLSPFAPADNSLPYSTYDSETGFEVKETDIKMDGSISAKELDAYLEEQQRKEMEYFASAKV